MIVKLEAKSNPDHRDGISIKATWANVSSLNEASAVCQKFISDNQLGSGNWTGGDVKDNGVSVARISYNGRIWSA